MSDPRFTDAVKNNISELVKNFLDFKDGWLQFHPDDRVPLSNEDKRTLIGFCGDGDIKGIEKNIDDFFKKKLKHFKENGIISLDVDIQAIENDFTYIKESLVEISCILNNLDSPKGKVNSICYYFKPILSCDDYTGSGTLNDNSYTQLVVPEVQKQVKEALNRLTKKIYQAPEFKFNPDISNWDLKKRIAFFIDRGLLIRGNAIEILRSCPSRDDLFETVGRLIQLVSHPACMSYLRGSKVSGGFFECLEQLKFQDDSNFLKWIASTIDPEWRVKEQQYLAVGQKVMGAIHEKVGQSTTLAHQITGDEFTDHSLSYDAEGQGGKQVDMSQLRQVPVYTRTINRSNQPDFLCWRVKTKKGVELLKDVIWRYAKQELNNRIESEYTASDIKNRFTINTSALLDRKCSGDAQVKYSTFVDSASNKTETNNSYRYVVRTAFKLNAQGELEVCEFKKDNKLEEDQARFMMSRSEKMPAYLMSAVQKVLAVGDDQSIEEKVSHADEEIQEIACSIQGDAKKQGTKSEFCVAFEFEPDNVDAGNQTSLRSDYVSAPSATRFFGAASDSWLGVGGPTFGALSQSSRTETTLISAKKTIEAKTRSLLPGPHSLKEIKMDVLTNPVLINHKIINYLIENKVDINDQLPHIIDAMEKASKCADALITQLDNSEQTKLNVQHEEDKDNTILQPKEDEDNKILYKFGM